MWETHNGFQVGLERTIFNKIKEVAYLVDTSRETYLDVFGRHVAAQSDQPWDRKLYNVFQLGLHIDEAISRSFESIGNTAAINFVMDQEGE